MRVPSLPEVRRLTEKERDAWWTVLLVDPVATPLVRWTAMWTRVTPNQITWAALVLGIGAAACFAQGDWQWLVAGAVVYHVSFILDCMDGKLARLTGKGSAFGAWLDYIFDRVRVLVCAIALMGGQYQRTEDVTYIWLAVAVVFLDMLRYMDALEIWKVRLTMRRRQRERAACSGGVPWSSSARAIRADRFSRRSAIGTEIKRRPGLRREQTHVSGKNLQRRPPRSEGPFRARFSGRGGGSFRR